MENYKRQTTIVLPSSKPNKRISLRKQCIVENINGDGPCNKERLAVRRTAEERGRWVRQALLAPKAKYVTPLA